VTCCGLELLVLFIYRPGSKAADIKFFNDLSEMCERLSHFLSPVVVGDFNLHVDISESAAIIKFNSLLEANNCRHYVDSATHNVSSVTINAPPPVINLRQSTTFSDLVPCPLKKPPSC